MTAGDDTARPAGWESSDRAAMLAIREGRVPADHPAAGPRAGDTAPDDDDAAYDAEMVRRCLETMDPVHIKNTLRNQVAELARLRSGAAALRDAGEALAAKAVDVSQAICGTEEMAAEILDDAVFAWRSAAGPSTTDGGDR